MECKRTATQKTNCQSGQKWRKEKKDTRSMEGRWISVFHRKIKTMSIPTGTEQQREAVETEPIFVEWDIVRVNTCNWRDKNGRIGHKQAWKHPNHQRRYVMAGDEKTRVTSFTLKDLPQQDPTEPIPQQASTTACEWTSSYFASLSYFAWLRKPFDVG